MGKLVSPEIAAELLNTTAQALITMACLRRKENGKYPDWYISNGKRGGFVSYIDIEVIERNNLIRKRLWNYATERLYWILESLDGYTMQDFARILASKTEDSENSWAMYLSRDMFNLPNGNVYELKETKLFTFIRIMTRLIYGSSRQLQTV
jgi:hypothetical protein